MKSNHNQQGFVSIIVTALIMVILTLITIGFTKIMQREQRQSIDKQLSRQALYAAESGINDVYSSLQANPNLPAEKTTCDVEGLVGGEQNPAVNNGVIDSKGDVAYTCALYDKTPQELVYNIGPDQSKVVQLVTNNGVAFSTMTIKWSNEEGNNDVGLLPVCGVDALTFPQSRSGTLPLMRIDLTNTNVLSRDSLIGGTDYMYLSPCKNGAANATHSFLVPASKGQVIQVPCFSSAIIPCEITITGLNSSASYAARIRPLYDSTKLTINGTDVSGGVVEFKLAQTSIDVTAKAGDVLRRLRVAIPLAEVSTPPEAGFQSIDGVCKQMRVDSISPAPRVDDNCN